jgi:metal-sulfur cluster biosynthetic enzyme
MTPDTITDRVLAALSSVQDPCSVATRHPLSIVELGLLVDLQISDDGDAVLLLRATSPSCTLIPSIMQAAEDRIAAVEGVRDVRVELDVDAVWTPELMPAGGREKLRAARARTVDALGIRPYAQRAISNGPGPA